MTQKLLIAVLILIAGYGCIEAWALLAGPSLSVDVPINNASVPGGIVEIKGRAMRAATLTLNGAPLLHDQEGNFSSTLTFPRGGSILTFAAADRFGRSVTATRFIFVPADASVGSPTSHVGTN